MTPAAVAVGRQAHVRYHLAVEFVSIEETLAAYQAVTKKAADYCAMRAVKSMLFHLLALLSDGAAERIARPSPWAGWSGDMADGSVDSCRLVASLLRGGSSHAIRRGVYGQRESVMRKKRHGHRTVIDQIAVDCRKPGAKRAKYKIKTFYKQQGKFYSRDYARAWAAAHTRMRRQHRGFIKILPREMIDAVMRRMVELGMKPGRKRPKGFRRNSKMTAKADGTALTMNTVGKVIHVAAQTWYTYRSPITDARKPSESSAANLEDTLRRLMPEAMRRVKADMRHYTLKKLGLWDTAWDEMLPPGT